MKTTDDAMPRLFVRITSGPYAGMTGELLIAASGSCVVRLTATGEEHLFDADDVTFDQRTGPTGTEVA